MFKFSLCSKATKKEINYDYCPYENKTVINAKEILQISSGETDTTSLYYSPSTASDCSSDVNLDTINISRWHSTKLDQQSMNDYSQLPTEIGNNTTIAQKQLSSTIREQTDRLVKKGYYNAPLDNGNYTVISHKPSYLQLPSQIEDCDSLCDSCSTYDSSSVYAESAEFYTMYDSASEYLTSSDETTIFPSSLVTNSTHSSDNESSSNDSLSTTATQDSFNNELDAHYSSDYFVCILDYKSKLEGDLSIKYSDKVKVINGGNSLASNNNFVFVQLLKNGKYGYVPKKCLISLAQYLKF